MYIRYELDVNDVSTGYGALVGAKIFELIPSDWVSEYTTVLEMLPDPVFEAVEGFHCISYFKVNTNANRLAEHLVGIIERGCAIKSLDGFAYTIRKVQVASLDNIIYEDAYQAVILVKGTSTFKQMELDGSTDSFEVQKRILLEVIEKLYEAKKL